MKKMYNKIALVLLAGSISFSLTSCGDEFLEEVKRDSISVDYLNEPDGLHSLSNNLYQNFNTFFSHEHAYAFTNYGTDEGMLAGDGANEMFNTYDNRLGSVIPKVNEATTASAYAFWDPLYQYISKANIIISKESVLDDYAFRGETLGLAYFVRGFNLLFLTMQYGDIPLVTEPATKPTRYYSRQSQDEVYKCIISDLEKAYELLPADNTIERKNYASKYTAAHYLAKAHLWRASEINDKWNSAYKQDDLNEVIKYADIVIAAHPLTPNYEDLFGNFTGYDTAVTEDNTEILLSSGSTDADINGRKENMMICMFTSWYQGFPLMKRDVAGTREFQRFKPCPSYTYFIYDLKNDSRFWKTFKTTYAINKCATAAKNGATKWVLGNGETITANQYFTSDDAAFMSAMYIINRTDYGQEYYKNEVNTVKTPTTAAFSRIDYKTGKYIPTIMALYIYDENHKVVGTSMQPDFETCYPCVNKYLDGAVDAYNLDAGYRDGVLARSAEDYFFKAEALVRQNKINEGLAALQPVRARAQFKANEERDKYVDGGIAYATNKYKPTLKNYEANSAFYPMNSYYYSVGGWDDAEVRARTNATASSLPIVTSGTYPSEDKYIFEKLNLSSEYDKALCFILNEKSREFYGELMRWMDLARTKTLESRLVFNDQCYLKQLKDITGSTKTMTGQDYASSTYLGAFDPKKHYYRPLPQTFLDNIAHEDGTPLTAEEKQSMQNPGY